MGKSQPGILADVPRMARYVSFMIAPDSNPVALLDELPDLVDGDSCVLGIGAPLVSELNTSIPGLSVFPALSGKGVAIPSTQSALWCWLRGSDRGELIHQTMALEDGLAPAFEINDVIDAFQYQDSRDLTGYEDGTENPEGEEAEQAAIVTNGGPGMEGSSFVAVQQWVHDLNQFQSYPQQEQDNIFGRRRSDNEELDDAPETAHVKRTAQESFDPEAFVVRRSMPWCDATDQGLVFVAFGHSFDAYDVLLKQMVGLNDGVVDGLFRFTRPISGSYYWCPPMKNGVLDLSALKK